MRRFKDHILKDKKFIREVAIILLVGIIVNTVCFLMGTIYSKAATSTPLDSNEPPFVVMNNPDLSYLLNGQFDYETLVNNVKQQYNLSDSDFIIGTSGASLRSYSSHWCVILNIYDNLTYYGNVLDVNDVTESRLNFQYSGKAENVYYDLSTNSIVGKWGTNPDVSWSTSTGTISLLGPVSTSTYNSGVFYFTTYYPIYTNNTIYSYDGTTPLISQYSYIVPGDFTELPALDQLLNNISNAFNPGSNGNTNTPDTNKTDIENFADFFNNLQSSINSNINNLGNNIKSWFDNLQQKLTDLGNSISTNIYNGFSTLMSNIRDFFGPKLDAIIEKLNYITEPFDQEAINDFIESSSVYSDISSINTSVTTFGSSFTGVSEPDDYTLTFHIEDIDILNQSQPFVLHLNILNPVKSTIRAMLWVIVSYGLFISVVDSLPNYINGGGGEDD